MPEQVQPHTRQAVSYARSKRFCDTDKVSKMKTLTFLLLLIPSFILAQYRQPSSCTVQSLKVQNIREKRARNVALTMLVTFAVAEIGNQINSKAMWDAGNSATLAVGAVGIVYVWRVDLFKPTRKNYLQVQRERK